jgi:hypothetical protein
MVIFKVIATAVAALVAGVLVEGARADETFVCDGGRLVRAKSADIETLKRTDVCIAQYFGLSVADAAEPAPAPMLARDVTSEQAGTTGRVIEPLPPLRLPSDHRNVVILNAPPGQSPYFVLRR